MSLWNILAIEFCWKANTCFFLSTKRRSAALSCSGSLDSYDSIVTNIFSIAHDFYWRWFFKEFHHLHDWFTSVHWCVRVLILLPWSIFDFAMQTKLNIYNSTVSICESVKNIYTTHSYNNCGCMIFFSFSLCFKYFVDNMCMFIIWNDQNGKRSVKCSIQINTPVFYALFFISLVIFFF